MDTGLVFYRVLGSVLFELPAFLPQFPPPLSHHIISLIPDGSWCRKIMKAGEVQPCCTVGCCLSLQSSCYVGMLSFPPTSSLIAYSLQTAHNSECQARLGYKVGFCLNKDKRRKERLKRNKVQNPKATKDSTSVLSGPIR